MSDWKIELVHSGLDVRMPHGLLVDFLGARWAWKHLSKSAQAAVAAAYPDGWVSAHPQTLRALDRHGFIISYDLTDYHLTDAGAAVAKWNVASNG